MLQMLNFMQQQVTPAQQQWFAWNQHNALAGLRQAYGDRLFVIVQNSLEAAPMAAAGFDAPTINPYKITGMILEACTLVELWRLLNDSKWLSEVMLEACDILQAADHRCKNWIGTDTA